MPEQSVELVKASQRDHAKRATLEGLIAKKPREAEYEFPLGEDGEKVSVLMRAINGVEYDRLVGKYPATTEQRAEGASFDINRFGPALLARVVVEPVATYDEWSDIWKSEAWSMGEVSELFGRASQLCGAGLDLSPIDAD